MKKIFTILFLTATTLYLGSCEDFINVVPENTATVDKAFKMRGQAEKALFTCYSYLTPTGSGSTPFPFYQASRSIFSSKPTSAATHINRGNQKVVNPYLNYWEGRNGGRNLYEAIRKCNVFINNLPSVTNMKEDEKKKWIAEAKFL